MKVILTQNIAKLGKAGEIKNVADGFAVNFLFPKSLAVIADRHNIETYKKIAEENAKKDEELIGAKKELLKKISSLEITITAKAKNGKLFGSIGSKEIKKVLEGKGILLENEQIIVPEPIREVGTRKFIVKLAKNLETDVQITISES